MLTTLRIKNLALVTDLTIELQPGYNVITGETGAGKSILIGALNLVLGERADRTLIRSGSDSCSVEAVFDIARIKTILEPLLDESGLDACQGNQLFLKRSFTSGGTNRQFVNGSPTSLSVLARMGEWLVDIHGPHEHQSLLRPSAQLLILDAFGKLDGIRGEFAELVRSSAQLEAEKKELIIDEASYAQQLDLLRFQVNEITSAHLEPGEAERVEQEYRRASNAARLLQLTQAAINLLSDNESSLLDQAGVVGRTLQELHRIDPGAGHLIAAHEQAAATLRELQTELSHYAEKIDIDPARLGELEERLNLLQSLKRKYGATVPDILALGEEARARLQTLEQRDSELSRINGELQTLKAATGRKGAELSTKRRKLVPQLGKAVSRQLADLGFNQSQFGVVLSTPDRADANEIVRPASPDGFDEIEFSFAPNPGEPTKPLRAIASSGELARVMLALKTVLATEDKIPVLVFDEVDANVGGETANVVGDKMQQIARQRQVLCITHLPQVAAPASAHYVVTKQAEAGRTITQVSLLNPQQRVTELARMLGGQTEAARKHAKELLNAT
jgi:DNA repair protein RecN (Recombination protein N)